MKRWLLLTAFCFAFPSALLAQSDKVFLKDGQVLSGRLATSAFKFNTIYGSVTVPNAACQSLEAKDEKVDVLSTVNKETITGYLADSVEIQLSGGP